MAVLIAAICKSCGRDVNILYPENSPLEKKGDVFDAKCPACNQYSVMTRQ